MAKEDDEDFEKYPKCWIWDNIYAEGDVKVRDHYHLIGKHGCSAHRSCNIKVKFNH